MQRGTNEYKNLHARLARARGKASSFQCVDCPFPAHGWSWIHDTDRLDFKNYEPRCRSCHAKYDGHVVHRDCKGVNNPNAKLTVTQIETIRSDYASGVYTHRKLAEKYGISRSHVHRIVSKETKVS